MGLRGFEFRDYSVGITSPNTTVSEFLSTGSNVDEDIFSRVLSQVELQSHLRARGIEVFIRILVHKMFINRMKIQGIMGIKAVGFDFDGTLIMSEEQKAKEMADVFREKFKVERGVEQAYTHLMGTGKNRNKKVEFLVTKFLKRKPTREELRQVEDHFGKHYKKSMEKCPLFQCTNIIRELRKQVRFLFLLSLENRKEVRDIVCSCNLAPYFDEILGGPESKVKNLRHVLKRHHLHPREIIYVGDTHADVIASKKVGVKTILLGKKHTYEKLKEDLEADFVFSSLCEVPKKVKKFG